VEIDAEACMGHGRCYELAPHVFDEDERGYGQVMDAELRPEHVAEARRAEDNCPEGAIQLVPARNTPGGPA
jgi:ferredoxin